MHKTPFAPSVVLTTLVLGTGCFSGEGGGRDVASSHTESGASAGHEDTGSMNEDDGTTGDADSTTGDADSTTDDSTSDDSTTDDSTTDDSTGDASTGEASVCGNGVVEGDEECDDGNDVDTDACTNACTHAVCGDGIVHEGVEECDDGNDVDTDACTNACTNAVCGDGIVHEGVEECDDGNDVDDDACSNSCQVNCGGVLFDPGNGITGCWYTAPQVGMTCTQLCEPHGGFDAVASQHTGNAVGMMFWPEKSNGFDWESVECSSNDNDTNWGANGNVPNAAFSHDACHVNCACNH
jgi:cysteine-rich repeat protein